MAELLTELTEPRSAADERADVLAIRRAAPGEVGTYGVSHRHVAGREDRRVVEELSEHHLIHESAYSPSSLAVPPSPSSSGRNVSTMTASSSNDSTPRLASIADGCGPCE